MKAISLPQPWPAALVTDAQRAIRWPSDWPLVPEVVGAWIGLHATLAWTADQRRHADALGLTPSMCPRGVLVGLGRVAGWARLTDDGPLGVLGRPPSWAEREPIADHWPLDGGRCALFFDESIALDEGIVTSGDATGPWTMSKILAERARLRVAAHEACAVPTPRPPTAAPIGSGRPPKRARRQGTPTATRLAEQLRDLVPPAWAVAVDGPTVSVLGEDGRCMRALQRPATRHDLADALVGLAACRGGPDADGLVAYIRGRQPWTDPKERAACP